MFDKLESIYKRYQEIEHLMAQPEVLADVERLRSLAKERASTEELVSLYKRYRWVEAAIQETQEVLEEGEPDLTLLAEEELAGLKGEKTDLESHLRTALLPKDPNEEKDIILEIRAGTGGEEASLFAADLARMYTRYAQLRGWKVTALDSTPSDLGGFKELVMEVEGKGAYSRLKHERGVHRVQRVPATESSGRIHTSTATVAVLPEADDVDLRINPGDLRIDIFHGGGPGGQNVNKVATAVRVTHIPTGIMAVCQDERSQLRNKQKALAVLRARLFDREVQKQQQEISSERRAQVGTGDRAEKVRTYNFPQDRLTDHRIGLTVYGLPRVLAGELDPIIDALTADEQARKLAEAVA